jgi:hypothetical protein
MNDDEDLITRIVAQLERGGPLNDPRDPRALSPADGDDLIITDAVAAIKSVGLDPELKAAIEASARERYGDDARIIWRTPEGRPALPALLVIPEGKAALLANRADRKKSRNAWAPATFRSEDLLSPLGTYVRAETRRCINRVRMPKELPPGKPGRPTAADYNRAIAAMERIAFTDSMREQIEWAKSVQLFPPDKRADMAKQDCAEESWFLMEYFSAQPPTGTEGGPFMLIAEFLFEGLTGSEANNMKRACAAVLKNRRPHSWRWDIWR